MSEKIPARFRKTKTDKWAVMAPIEDLESALAAGGKVDVLKKSGDWSSFQVASLGKPFDVDGVQMCYGYGPDDGADDSARRSGGQDRGQRGGAEEAAFQGQPRTEPIASVEPPPVDNSEPLPTYQGGPEDEWAEGF